MHHVASRLVSIATAAIFTVAVVVHLVAESVRDACGIDLEMNKTTNS